MVAREYVAVGSMGTRVTPPGAVALSRVSSAYTTLTAPSSKRHSIRSPESCGKRPAGLAIASGCAHGRRWRASIAVPSRGVPPTIPGCAVARKGACDRIAAANSGSVRRESRAYNGVVCWR